MGFGKYIVCSSFYASGDRGCLPGERPWEVVIDLSGSLIEGVKEGGRRKAEDEGCYYIMALQTWDCMGWAGLGRGGGDRMDRDGYRGAESVIVCFADNVWIQYCRILWAGGEIAVSITGLVMTMVRGCRWGLNVIVVWDHSVLGSLVVSSG